MTRGEAVNWLINIMADIGKAEHRELWHYEQALSEIREMLQSEPERKTGKWVVYKSPDKYHCGLVKCPFCSEEMIAEADEYNYCPSCGAEMDF